MTCGDFGRAQIRSLSQRKFFTVSPPNASRSQVNCICVKCRTFCDLRELVSRLANRFRRLASSFGVGLKMFPIKLFVNRRKSSYHKLHGQSRRKWHVCPTLGLRLIGAYIIISFTLGQVWGAKPSASHVDVTVLCWNAELCRRGGGVVPPVSWWCAASCWELKPLNIS